MKIKIVDTNFAHTVYKNYTINRPNKYFEWDRGFNQHDVRDDELIFFTDNSMHGVSNYPKGRKIGWLIEPLDKQSKNYHWAIQNCHLFEYILTYEKTLLDLGKNFVYYVAGGCWIDETDCGLHKKSKLISTVISNKMNTEHHKFRHFLKSQGCYKNVDVYGSGGDIKIPADSGKIIAYKDYMFQIVVDQGTVEYGFTEKIIDCFATGVIPIYRGVRDVLRYFDEDGIIFFNTEKDLMSMLEHVDENLYYAKHKSVKKNYEISKKFYVPEDWLYENVIIKKFI